MSPAKPAQKATKKSAKTRTRRRPPNKAVKEAKAAEAAARKKRAPAPPSVLEGRHIRHLRALAHDLDPVVQVGKEALSEGLVSATDRALLDHELIKVRLPQVSKEEREELSRALVEGTRSTLVQNIGRIVVLYRPHPTEPRIPFPR